MLLTDAIVIGGQAVHHKPYADRYFRPNTAALGTYLGLSGGNEGEAVNGGAVLGGRLYLVNV